MSQPTTALIVLGDAMFFQAESDDVLSITIMQAEKEYLCGCLEARKAAQASLDNIHIVVKCTNFSTLYDPEAIKSFEPYLRPGAAMTVHILANTDVGSKPGEDDIDAARMSLVLGGLRMEVEQAAQDDSWVLTAKKPSADPDDSDEE
mmetsp:Transcript_24017/g.48605  ORF Transcript_24017/g.48605 Transcript_24017/m.48605 type:complete len:147 (-) Transcript_24017:214-654(-)|eukprot:CAMPEP_0183307528 /NCGR_PEP_ID=MMETSP0160_2-20130417/17872_1 /TAXON_ID=2839 ORGANISM="Odontella Sinensis, Strain Grunow 1884" /NCGR_SAMPLE_ID=MMETSP0160_2 /ASSEMBLY_ACC=CAM_ASM_000250 /LENGTH=146 /DNA_ID=CAMNT_0025471135 /DNA_START=140 /DNA_END=580 /DNA_ORIENTATION=+